MSYNLSLPSTLNFALLSCQSAGSGLVTFSYVDGDFTPSISTTTITLDAGYEYSIFTSLTTSSSSAVSYNHIVDGVSGTSYTIGVTSTTSGLDQLFDQVTAINSTSFSITTDSIITTNSRIEIWRIAL